MQTTDEQVYVSAESRHVKPEYFSGKLVSDGRRVEREDYKHFITTWLVDISFMTLKVKLSNN